MVVLDLVDRRLCFVGGISEGGRTCAGHVGIYRLSCYRLRSWLALGQHSKRILGMRYSVCTDLLVRAKAGRRNVLIAKHRNLGVPKITVKHCFIDEMPGRRLRPEANEVIFWAYVELVLIRRLETWARLPLKYATGFLCSDNCQPSLARVED